MGAELKILLAAQGHVIVTSARVRHETARGTTVLVGVEFEPLTPEHRRQWELCLAFALARATADRPAQVRPPAERPRRETIRDNSRELTAFLSLLGRELRPALRAISRNSRQILKSPLFPEEAERARLIHDLSRYLLGVAHHVRGMGKQGRKEVLSATQTYDPRSVLRSALTLVRPSARLQGTWFREVVEPAVPARLKGSGLSLHEFFVEFLSAAVRLADGPRITVEMDWGSAGLAVRILDPTGGDDQAPKRTLPGHRLTALAERLGARVALW